MASVQRWKLIVCFVWQLIDNSQPSKSGEAGNQSIEKSLRVQSFETGYATTNHYGRRTLEDPESGIDGCLVIKKTFGRLKCGYLYGAQLHLHLTKELFSKTNRAVIRTNGVRDFKFIDEATFMVDSLFSEMSTDMDEVWLLYAYAVKTTRFFQNIDDQSKHVGGAVFERNKQMHDYVAEKIDNHLTECSFYNEFNMKYNLRVESIRNIKVDTATVLEVIKENKASLQKMYDHNVAKGLARSVDGMLLYSVLTVGGVAHFRSSIGGFLRDNGDPAFVETVLPVLLDKFRRSVFDDGLRGIRRLKLYLHAVFKTMEIITLRMTRLFVRLLDQMIDTDVDGARQYASTYNADVLKRFVDDISLNDDGRGLFEKFQMRFDQVYSSGTCLTEHGITDTIKVTINEMSCSLGFPDTLPMESDKSIDGVMDMAKNFISKIYDTIGGHTNIKMIRSFQNVVVEYEEFLETVTDLVEKTENKKKMSKKFSLWMKKRNRRNSV